MTEGREELPLPQTRRLDVLLPHLPISIGGLAAKAPGIIKCDGARLLWRRQEIQRAATRPYLMGILDALA